MIQYNYVENEEMHTFVTNDKREALGLIKRHWDEGANISYQLIVNNKVSIDMDGLEELRRIRMIINGYADKHRTV